MGETVEMLCGGGRGLGSNIIRKEAAAAAECEKQQQ